MPSSIATALLSVLAIARLSLTAPAAEPASHSSLSVLENVPEGLAIAYTEQAGNYTIAYFVKDPTYIESYVAAVEQRAATACGQNLVQCGTNNKASSDACGAVLTQISRIASTRAPLSPRQVCAINRDSRQCCISWSKEVANLQYGFLLPAAAKTFDECDKGTGVSGLARDVILNGVCMTQCLSDRGTGCR